MRPSICLIVALPIVVTALAGPASADFVINDDLIVENSACIGFDCVNGEVFGFDTLILKENNLRILFNDTSVAASFPRNDWRLVANDSANGGQSKFSIEDVTGNRVPFTVEANARSNSLYVDDGGRIGIRTSTPAVELHVVDGDSPTLRLQQDGSSGFAPQTWDVAGNETNFFIRDVTNGSALPFRIRPGAASSSIFIDSDSDVGIGTSSPTAPLHVRRADGTAKVLIEEASTTTAGRVMLELQNNGVPRIRMTNTQDPMTTNQWDLFAQTSRFRVRDNDGNVDFDFQDNGDFKITGNFFANNVQLNAPDYVFDEDYKLMPLDELETFIAKRRHLPNIPSAKQLKSGGLNMTEMQMKLLEKVEELTLYNLQQAKKNLAQEEKIRELQARLDALEGRAEK